MHKSDPPCIPYLGMYLMDLVCIIQFITYLLKSFYFIIFTFKKVFIEESTPDFADGLINFSKLRMVNEIFNNF